MERSGLRWVSYQTAAKKLGCSVEEIDQFVASHLVRSLNDGEARFVAEGDLDDLVQIKEAPPVNTVHLARNQALIMERLERLEEAINLLYEANGLTSFRMGHLEDQTLVELAANIEADRVFKRSREVVWKCRNCGYLHTGTEAPEKCPACVRPRDNFELLGENW